MMAPLRPAVAATAAALLLARFPAAAATLPNITDRPFAFLAAPTRRADAAAAAAGRSGLAATAGGAAGAWTASASASTAPSSRRSILSSFASASAAALAVAAVPPPPALADEARDEKNAPRVDLDSCLYSILRVREATEQETRLIKSGKFKDVQRANVKLAVRFILNNYRLGDNFIAAAGTLEGQRRVRAGEAGQKVVQDLSTILEYFDSSDIDNLKVASTAMAGKEGIVLSGLDTARRGIDDFLSYFPESKVESVKAKIRTENELNEKEFDPSLGAILNPSPVI